MKAEEDHLSPSLSSPVIFPSFSCCSISMRSELFRISFKRWDLDYSVPQVLYGQKVRKVLTQACSKLTNVLID